MIFIITENNTFKNFKTDKYILSNYLKTRP